MAIQKLLMCRILSLKGAEKAPVTETQSISFEADTVQIAGEKTAVSYQPKQSDKPNQGAKTTHAKNKIQTIQKTNQRLEKRIAKCHWRQLGGMGKAEEHNNMSRTEAFSSLRPLHCKSLVCLCASVAIP